MRKWHKSLDKPGVVGHTSNMNKENTMTKQPTKAQYEEVIGTFREERRNATEERKVQIDEVIKILLVEQDRRCLL